MKSLHARSDAPSDALMNSLEVRLPWSCLAPMVLSAERHGLRIRTDEDAHEIALRGVAEHLIEMCNGSDGEAQVVASWMGNESLQFFAVVVCESLVGHMRSREPDWPVSRLWQAS